MITTRVLVRGIGDVGSAVAHALFRAGARVVVHDVTRPAHTRRGMAFTDAMFSGKTQLDGVYAKRPRQPEDLRCMVDCGRAVPVVSGDIDDVVSALNPDVVIDARMRIRARDVALALTRPSDISVLNILHARVTEISAEQGPSASVRMDVGSVALVARITRHSVERLDLRPGREVYALIKAISLDRHSSGFA